MPSPGGLLPSGLPPDPGWDVVCWLGWLALLFPGCEEVPPSSVICSALFDESELSDTSASFDEEEQGSMRVPKSLPPNLPPIDPPLPELLLLAEIPLPRGRELVRMRMDFCGACAKKLLQPRSTLTIVVASEENDRDDLPSGRIPPLSSPVCTGETQGEEAAAESDELLQGLEESEEEEEGSDG